MAAVEVDGLSVVLESDGTPIIEDVSLGLDAGEVMGVVGESGSGKSTLSLALLGFVRPGARIEHGSVRIGGTDLLGLGEEDLRRARWDRVAYVPQDPATALNPSIRIGTQLTEALHGPRGEARARVAQILDTVGLPADDAFLRRRPRQLSGGQQQRVAIAMAVAAGPDLIVLDEPTTGLDVSTQAKVLELVARLCAENSMAAVYVSHDLAVVGEVADRVTVMYGGEVVESGPTARMLAAPAHPYTRALLGAVPSARERLRLRPIPGRVPVLGEERRGCVFAPRCPYATELCRTSRPELVPVPGPEEARSRCVRLEHVLAEPMAIVKEPSIRILDEPVAEAALAARGLDAGYGGRQVLFDVSVTVPKGHCVAVVGESGSGKSTLSRCLIGLHEEQSGAVSFAGTALAARAAERPPRVRHRLQYIFQNPYGSLNPRRSILSSVEAPLRLFFGMRGDEARRRAREALERVQIPWAFAERHPAELSGGQRQRVAIARALVCEPEVMICDEVTSGLDVSVQASVVELLRGLLEDGLSMLFVTHNLAVVRSIADTVVVLSEGRVVESGSTETVLAAPQEAYTRRLLADTLEVGGVGEGW